MPEPASESSRQFDRTALLVASSGPGPEHGLYRFTATQGRWSGVQLAQVTELAALVWHPVLPIVYGVSGSGDGTVHAWDVSAASARMLAQHATAGVEPCHLAIDHDARMLVVANYESGTLAVWPLDSGGELVGEAQLISLHGSGPDPARQGSAHPHFVRFSGSSMFVVDLGADAVHVFDVRRDGDDWVVPQHRADVSLPSGSGPRHAVQREDGRLVISGELSSVILEGEPNATDHDWSAVASTERARAGSVGVQNYPGDIQLSTDARFAYLANRGRDTIATFELSSAPPKLVGEIGAGGEWPQHLLCTKKVLLVALRDSSRVVAMPLEDGIPAEPETLFECAGASWLLMDSVRR